MSSARPIIYAIDLPMCSEWEKQIGHKLLPVEIVGPLGNLALRAVKQALYLGRRVYEMESEPGG